MDLDYKKLFESAPSCLILLAPDSPRFTILEVSDAYLGATRTCRSEILGRPLFEVFPDNPDLPDTLATRNSRASIERAIALGLPDALAVQRHDLLRTEAQGGGFEERYWGSLNTPVLGEGGEVICVIHRIEDVTELMRMKEQGAQALTLSGRGAGGLPEWFSRPGPFRPPLLRGSDDAGVDVPFQGALGREAEEARVQQGSEEGFRLLVDTIPHLCWMANAEGWIFWYNKRWYDYTGKTLEELKGWGWQSVHDPERLPQIMERWMACIQDGKPFEMVFPLRGADGGFRYFLNRGVPTLGPDGKVSRWFGTNTDVTEREQAEEALMNAVPAAIFMAHDQACLTMSGNRVAQDLIGLSSEANPLNAGLPSQWLTTYVAARHGQEIRPECLPVQLAARGVPVRDYEFDLHFPDGTVRTLLGNAVPLLDAAGQPRGAVGAFMDITLRKRLEEALKEEVRRKDDFLALLGHELRNPLAPMRNAVQLIRKTGQDPERRDAACAILERQLTQVARLVDDLLDLSRFTHGTIQLQLREIDLVETVRMVLEDFQPVLEEHGLALEADLAPGRLLIEGDPARITQAVSNLVHNAIKFTDPGGRLQVSVAANGAGRCQVRVKDTGIGISSEGLPALFRPFSQSLQTIGRSRGGLGLGLPLAKGLAERHGGTLSALSGGLGQGSEFIFEVPLLGGIAEASAEGLPEASPEGLPEASPEGLPEASPEGSPEASPKTEAAPAAMPACSPRRILIIEDLADAATTLQMVLQMLGHTVEVALDGKTGLQKAATFRPGILLCDIGLPGGVDGFEVVRVLRETPSLRAIHSIAMTGFGTRQDKEQALRAGFDAHLTKPVDPELWAGLIARIPELGNGGPFFP